MDSHTDICVVSSNVLAVHDHSCKNVYGFDSDTGHSNACAIDAAIVYEEPKMHFTMIIMINHAIKIDSMSNILVCLMH